MYIMNKRSEIGGEIEKDKSKDQESLGYFHNNVVVKTVTNVATKAFDISQESNHRTWRML